MLPSASEQRVGLVAMLAGCTLRVFVLGVEVGREAHMCCVCVCEVRCILTVPVRTEVVEAEVSAHQMP